MLHGIILWNLTGQQSLGDDLPEQTAPVEGLAYSPNGKVLASCSDNQEITLWDASTRQPLGKPLPSFGAVNLAFSPDGRILASGDPGNTIRFWDVAHRQQIGGPLDGHGAYNPCFAFSPDGRTLAAGVGDRDIVIWDLASHSPIGEPLTGHATSVSSLTFSPDGKTLATGDTNGTILLWDTRARHRLRDPLKGHDGRVSALAFSRNCRLLISASDMDPESPLLIWDLATGQVASEPFGHPTFLAIATNGVSSLDLSMDGKILAVGGDFTALWNMDNHEFFEPRLPSEAVYKVAFSPDGKTLASANGTKNYALGCERQILGIPC